MVRQVRGSQEALLVFADIIDSSKFSAVLQYEDYAKRILEYQESFVTLGDRYFPEPGDKTQEFRSVVARGDEGIVFVLTDIDYAPRMILRAVEFLMHLKAYLKLTTVRKLEADEAPVKISVAAGIHFGRVALVNKLDESGHSIIDRIEGFEINYAKRVESSSRNGTHSRIMLSECAYRMIEGAPLFFNQVCVPMKGIADAVNVYEVCGGLYSFKIHSRTDERDQQLISQIRRLAEDPAKIGESWLKSLVISILDGLIRSDRLPQQQLKWRKLQEKVAWHSTNENDPLLLYFRAKVYGEEGLYTQQLRYLRQIMEKHPSFVHGRKAMIGACGKIAKDGTEPFERVFARDLAKEFLSKYPEMLNETEKEEYTALIAELAENPPKK